MSACLPINMLECQRMLSGHGIHRSHKMADFVPDIVRLCPPLHKAPGCICVMHSHMYPLRL